MKNGKFLFKFSLSFSGMAVAISNNYSIKWIIVNGFISLILWCFLLFKTNLFNEVFPGHFSKKRMFLSFISSAGIAFSWMTNGRLINAINFAEERTIEELNHYITLPIEYNAVLMIFARIGIFGLAIISIPALFFFLYWFYGIFYQTLQSFIQYINKYEIVYLIIINIIVIILLSFVYNLTVVFSEPALVCDIIFTSDSLYYIKVNAFLIISAWGNNFRQPLFGLFAMPFTVYPFLISKILFFIPNIYPITIQILQAFMLHITIILLARMIKLRGISAFAFYLITSLSYPYLLFTFMIEQYIFPIFYITLLLYSYLNKDIFNKKNKQKLFFIAAAGSMITSGILISCAVSHKGKNLIKEIATLGVVFLFAVILCGQTNIIWEAFSDIMEDLNSFASSVSIIDKLLQYLNFIALCIIKPDVILVNGEFISYQLAPVTSFNYYGILLFILIGFSFTINWKNKLAQICIVWVLYSCIILFAIGWGTAENGLVLYSLYFAWSFLVLLFMGIEKFLIKLPLFKYVIYTVLILYLASVNIPAIYDIIHFGIIYYPAH